MQEYSKKDDLRTWSEKGATLIDSTACREFSLSRQEIIEAIKSGKLQYRDTSIYGNPCLRLLRSEIESFVTEKYGESYIDQKKLENELSQVNKKLKKLKSEMQAFEQRKTGLLKLLNS